MKKQIVNHVLSGIFIMLTLHACTFPKCSSGPETLRLKILSKIDSTDLMTSGYYKMDTISIYYLDKNVRKDVTIQIEKDEITNKTLLNSNDITSKSLEGFKDFYVYLNYKDQDTIFLDVVSKEDGHCTSNPINSFKYNNQVIQLDNKEYLYKILK